jgi:hypothetical protein
VAERKHALALILEFLEKFIALRLSAEYEALRQGYWMI